LRWSGAVEVGQAKTRGKALTRSLFEELNDPTVRDRLAQQLPFPPVVISFLGRLCLLHGVPLSYLLPDEKLLPPESLKFFFIDPQWIALWWMGHSASGGQTMSACCRARQWPGIS